MIERSKKNLPDLLLLFAMLEINPFCLDWGFQHHQTKSLSGDLHTVLYFQEQSAYQEGSSQHHFFSHTWIFALFFRVDWSGGGICIATAYPQMQGKGKQAVHLVHNYSWLCILKSCTFFLWSLWQHPGLGWSRGITKIIFSFQFSNAGPELEVIFIWFYS